MRFLRAVATTTFVASALAMGSVAKADDAVGTNPGLGGIDLSVMGVKAPSVEVGSTEIKAGTLQYSNSGGSSDAFSVGTSTSISASASASSTPDYAVESTANFGIDASAIQQVIGTSGSTNNTRNNSYSVDVERSASASAESSVSRDFKQEVDGSYWWRRNNEWTSTTESEYNTERKSAYDSAYSRAYQDINSAMSDSGTISGSFAKTSEADASSNDVTVKGIGADNTVTAANGSMFNSSIAKDDKFTPPTTGGSAGTASGSAAGNVSTTASANANSTQFVSSFVQAY